MIPMLLALLACARPASDDADTAAPMETADPAANETLRPRIDRDRDGHLAAVDCDDSNPAVHRGASEVCDGLDNDCDGLVDVADPDFMGAAHLAYQDFDGDGWGNPQAARPYCLAAPDGFVDNDLDCDDTDPGQPLIQYTDADGDGCGSSLPGLPTVVMCWPVDGYAQAQNDCDDGDAEVCDC